MNKLASFAALALLAGCAAGPGSETANAERRERVEAPTGSNIPRRTQTGDVTVYDRESVERAQSGSYGGIPRVPAN